MYGSRIVQRKIMEETYNNCFKTLVKTGRTIRSAGKRKLLNLKHLNNFFFLIFVSKLLRKM